MSFVSLQFPLFLAGVLLGLAIMPTRGSRQAFLLVANVVFYAAGTPWFILVLLVPAIVDYACAIRMEESPDPRTRRRWLILSLVVNLGVLFYFKYADFLVDAVASALGVQAAPLMVVLPVGISFFTFKTMSYTIDVYRGTIHACRRLWHYTMFVSFFPELVAGPIVRASVFLPQMTRHLQLSGHRFAAAIPLILLGLSKKLLVADRLAVFVDPVFANPGLYSQGTVASAVVAYALQIYCDFSGYTDIAIGVARMIGFDLPENFNMPYLATSITDFWRRWHMTLSSWLRDYLYVPLGGNRRGRARTYVNLLITMVLGGLWHGAAWTFVLWGLYQGAGLAVHKLWSEHFTNPLAPRRINAVGAWALTFAFVCGGWVLFRAPDMATAGIIAMKVIGAAPGGVEWFFLPFWLLLFVVAGAHALGVIAERQPGIPEAVEAWMPARRLRLLRLATPRGTVGSAFLVTAWLILLFLFSPMTHSPFIYFQF
ncbi:MAG TPA: MBOAT family protein [Gemmatimonadaceae bacterium]|nr:MBOAT family protein [Gemmatimonadaceae bacterium]